MAKQQLHVVQTIFIVLEKSRELLIRQNITEILSIQKLLFKMQDVFFYWRFLFKIWNKTKKGKGKKNGKSDNIELGQLREESKGFLLVSCSRDA